MNLLNRPIQISFVVLVFAARTWAQDGNSTTVTLPGGFTISTTSLIVGTLAVVVVAVVGVVFAARRMHSGHTTNTIFQNVSRSTLRDVRSETRTSSPEYTNSANHQPMVSSAPQNNNIFSMTPQEEEMVKRENEIARAEQETVKEQVKEYVIEKRR